MTVTATLTDTDRASISRSPRHAGPRIANDVPRTTRGRHACHLTGPLPTITRFGKRVTQLDTAPIYAATPGRPRGYRHGVIATHNRGSNR